jgi:hypothetical protein
MVFLFLARIVGRIDELDTSGPGEHNLDDRLLVCRTKIRLSSLARLGKRWHVRDPRCGFGLRPRDRIIIRPEGHGVVFERQPLAG